MFGCRITFSQVHFLKLSSCTPGVGLGFRQEFHHMMLDKGRAESKSHSCHVIKRICIPHLLTCIHICFLHPSASLDLNLTILTWRASWFALPYTTAGCCRPTPSIRTPRCRGSRPPASGESTGRVGTLTSVLPSSAAVAAYLEHCRWGPLESGDMYNF